MFAEKTLLVVCLTFMYAESNRSRIACVMLEPDPERIRIENLQNRIGSGLKKIRVRIPLVCSSNVLIFVLNKNFKLYVV